MGSAPGGTGHTSAWSADTLFAGPGRTRAALRATDWSRTPLGPVEGWPVELRAAIRTVLPSRIPMLLWWGPQLVQIFNDAYTPVLGDKYPAAVGQPGAECWSEVWDQLEPLTEQVLTGGGATYAENQLLLLRRHGYLEETYWTFSYSPVHADDGTVAGIFVATTDVTARILADRRLETLRELGALSIAQVDTAADACRAAVAVLASRRNDIPLAMVYLRTEPAGHSAGPPPADDDAAPVGAVTLVASVGVREVVGQPEIVGLPEVVEVFRTGQAEHVTGLAARQPATWQSGRTPGAAPVDDALVLPLQVSGRTRPDGVLVVGTSPYRELDEPYQSFLHLVAGQVSTALTDALAYETERLRAESLAELDAAKTAFFTNVSHELRTPLTLIAAPLQDSLNDRDDPLPAAHLERLEIAHRNADRLAKLVNDVLDFVRIEDGRLEPAKEPTDLAGLTRSVAESFGYAMRRAGLTFTIDTPQLPRSANVDRAMWEKIVINLLSNALKYTLSGEVRLALRDAGPEVEFTVSDTGVGIPADQLPLLFERFHRVRGSRGRSHEGTGIGLALVHELVRMHGGTAQVRSVDGQGSTFTVRLPYGPPAPPTARRDTGGGSSAVARYAEEALRWLPADLAGTDLPGDRPAESAPTGIDRPTDRTATVLVVDDNPDLRTFIAGLLEPHYRVFTAADGAQALARIDTATPDLILTDVMMPELDGFELLRALRDDPRTALVPVIILSARAGEESTVEGLRAGADDYLVKPFSSNELLARVHAHLELARRRNHESAWRGALVESLQDAFVVVDDTGTVLEVNEAFRRLVGYDTIELPLPPPHPWWPDAQAQPAERRHVETAARETLAVENGRTVVPLQHADGHQMWVEAVFSSLRDPDTGRRVHVSTLRDVTVDLLVAAQQVTLNRMSSRLAEATGVHEVLATGLSELQELLGSRRTVAVSFTELDGPEVVAGFAPLTARVRRALAAVTADDPVHVAVDHAGNATGLSVRLESGGWPAALWLELDPPRPASDVDRDQLTLLAGTLAHALTRAQAYDAQRAVALALQRSILGPVELPAGFAVRYEPAFQPLEVGGDWYDVVRLANGNVGVVVGDCVGRGLPAATVMGQLRSACRALLLQAKGPGAVLRALDDFARLTPAASCTTVFCAIIDQVTGVVRYSTAGHPPAILVHRDGHELLDGARSFPLATIPVDRRPEATAQLRPDSILLLYTDGLVERRTERIDVGINRVVGALVDGRAVPEEQLIDQVMRATLPDVFGDDVAVLIYRHSPTSFRTVLAADPNELPALRQALRDWLAEAGIDQGDIEAVLLATSEACSNSIEHAYGFARTGELSLEISVVEGAVRSVVRDHGGWREPPTDNTHRGHGLLIMEHMMDTATVQGTPEGTTVSLVRRLSRPAGGPSRPAHPARG